MVHLVIDANGRLDLPRAKSGLGWFVTNASTSLNVTINVDGRPTITLLPYTKIRVPDTAHTIIQGASSHRNYIVMAAKAGEEF